MPSRHTSDKARIARALKGIKGEVDDLKEEVRGRDDPVHVVRQCRLAARTFVHGVTIQVYDAADVVPSVEDWDSLTRQEKRLEISVDHSPDRVITRDSRTTTDAYHEWVAATMGRDGGTNPATALHVGTGDPTTHDTDTTALDAAVDSLPLIGGAYSHQYRPQGTGRVTTFVDYDELVGAEISEIGLETELSEDLVGLAGFDDGYVKANDDLLTIDFQIGIEDADGPDGHLLDGFAFWLGLILSGTTRGPIVEATLGTDPTPALDLGAETIGQPIADAPVTDWDLYTPDPASETAEFNLVSYVDAAIAVGETLTEVGLVADGGEFFDDALVTWAQIEPDVERTALENLSVETSIVLEHA